MWESDEETLALYLGSLYESYYLGIIGPGFLNQVPTLYQPLGRPNTKNLRHPESTDHETVHLCKCHA